MKSNEFPVSVTEIVRRSLGYEIVLSATFYVDFLPVILTKSDELYFIKYVFGEHEIYSKKLNLCDFF